MITKAKLFGKIAVEFQENPLDKKELILSKPIVIQPKAFIGNLKIKLPKSIDNLLNKNLEINQLYWRKPNEISVKIPINTPKSFAKVEKYLHLESVSIIVKTDKKILST